MHALHICIYFLILMHACVLIVPLYSMCPHTHACMCPHSTTICELCVLIFKVACIKQACNATARVLIVPLYYCICVLILMHKNKKNSGGRASRTIVLTRRYFNNAI